MVGFALGFLNFGKKYWKIIAVVAVVLSVAYAITLMVRSYNDAIEEAVTEKQRAENWKIASEKWEASFRAAESLREQEAGQAISSANRERIVCNKRVADALQTRERINVITRVVPNESNQICPPAGLITSDELRAVLGAN